MKYFFVSQRQTHKEEHSQNYLWAPRDGVWHHKTMSEVKKGDAIIQYTGKIVGVGIALKDCYNFDRPEDNGFNRWEKQGYKVDVEQFHFVTPVEKGSVKEALLESQPEYHAPLNVNGDVNQGYLFPANEAMLGIILQKASEIDSSPRQSEIVKQIQEKLNIDLSKKNESEPDQGQDAMNKSDSIQKIFFGAPGTGKSHKIDYNLFKDKDGNLIGKGIKEIPEDRKFRTTFHPDYDYAQFVGAYKPKKELNNTTNKEELTYSFVPQVFAKAYAAAWKQYFAAGNVSTAGNQVYLVIEEINRGNCAQIFGDIFQLLDRVGDGADKGFSQYSIDADCDFATWLREDSILKTVWSGYEAKVGDGKLKLPPNLNILATMNTSDQSLFPMDSAFKRRFDWEYVPINYKMPKADFKVGKGDLSFDWLHFLKKVNADIRSVTESEDKQMGEFFIKPKDNGPITLEEFRSKVLFYLWDTVYKDETDKKNLFHFPYPEKGPGITFQRLFEEDEAGKLSDNSKKIIRKMLETLDAAYDSEEYNDFKIFPVKTEPTEDK